MVHGPYYMGKVDGSITGWSIIKALLIPIYTQVVIFVKARVKFKYNNFKQKFFAGTGLVDRSEKWKYWPYLWSSEKILCFMFLLISIHDLIDFSFNLFKKCWCVVVDSSGWWTNRLPSFTCLLFQVHLFILLCETLELFLDSYTWLLIITYYTKTPYPSMIDEIRKPIQSHSFATLSKSSSFRTICSHRFAECFFAFS